MMNGWPSGALHCVGAPARHLRALCSATHPTPSRPAALRRSGPLASLLRLLTTRVFGQSPPLRYGRRAMLRNSRESLWLLTPFVLWGTVVLIMHVLGYVEMAKVGGVAWRGVGWGGTCADAHATCMMCLPRASARAGRSAVYRELWGGVLLVRNVCVALRSALRDSSLLCSSSSLHAPRGAHAAWGWWAAIRLSL